MPDAAAQSPDQQTLDAIGNTYLGYIETGDVHTDRRSEAGLDSLGRALSERTNIENQYIEAKGDPRSNLIYPGPVMPRGLDPEEDDLSVYPFIYWAINPGQAPLSGKAIDNLNKYMRNGGMLFIDTRDRSTNGRGQTWLKRAVEQGLDIPALKPVEGCADVKKECHVLGKSFYLLQEFPGRYERESGEKELWAEATELYRKDGVARVIIGGLDWAAAWAKNERGEYEYPMMGNDPEQREYAIRTGINIVMYALTGNYKADQVHIPAIMDRMDGNLLNPR